MNKVARAPNEDAVATAIADPAGEKEALILKKKKVEADIRTKLDQFAKELNTARKQRGDH